MIGVFYFFAVILILLSARSFNSGLRFRRFFERELAKPRPEFTPFVTVVAPCRGVDDGLEINLRSVLAQDYPAFEIIFVVDDEADQAVPVIESVRAESSTRTKLVTASKAERSSQKVENLREGVLHADPASEAFVFVDSDVRVGRDWLRDLVAPLEDASTGAATSYRWFISERPTFSSEMRSAWNASIASALGPDTSTNFCWGGSMSVRRDVFDLLDIRDKWQGTLSDDFAVTRAMNEARSPIVFVPAAMPVTLGACTLKEVFEFTTRQMKITRVNAPKLWLMSLFGSLVFNAVLIASVLILIFIHGNAWATSMAAITLVLVTAFSVAKAWLRLEAVRSALKGYDAHLGRQRFAQYTLWLVVPAVFFYNSLAALFSRRLIWRGTRYELKSPNETVIITD